MATPVRVLSAREVPVEIKLDVNGKLAVLRDPFRVSKSRQEEVWWSCSDPTFSIDFKPNDSPFYDEHFDNDNPCSGLVRRKVPPGSKSYKYTVRAFGKVLDPDGQVDP